MSNDEINVRHAAVTFFEKMARWEKRNWEMDSSMGDDENDHYEERVDDLRKIFSQHLTKKAISRKQKRQDQLYYDDPSSFDKEIRKIEQADKLGYWVYIPEGIASVARYLFIKENEEWKVDYKESGIGDGKWDKGLHI